MPTTFHRCFRFRCFTEIAGVSPFVDVTDLSFSATVVRVVASLFSRFWEPHDILDESSETESTSCWYLDMVGRRLAGTATRSPKTGKDAQQLA